MKTVWFIRHAESEANAGLLTADVINPRLTPRGLIQADHIARAFESKPELIVTSPFIRTQLTAQPTLERFGDVKREEWPVQEFINIARSRTANTTFEQREVLYGDYWQRSDPHYNDGDGAESFADLLGRVQAMLDHLKQRDEAFIAIFTHAEFLCTTLWTILFGSFDIDRMAMERFRHFDLAVRIPNTSVVRALFSETGEIYLSALSTAHFPPDPILP